MSKSDKFILYVGIVGISPRYVKGSYTQSSKKSQGNPTSNLLPAVLERYPTTDIPDFAFPKTVYNYIFPIGVPILPDRPTRKLEGHSFAYITARGRLAWGVAQQFALPMGDEVRGSIQARYSDISATARSHSTYAIFILTTEGYFSKLGRILSHFAGTIQSERDFQDVCQCVYEIFPARSKLPYKVTVDKFSRGAAYGNMPIETPLPPTEAPAHLSLNQKLHHQGEISALSQAIMGQGKSSHSGPEKQKDTLTINFTNLANTCFPPVSVNFLTLFQYVSPQAIVDTLEAILQSRPVLFIGKSLARVSMCVIEVWTLLAPFSYPFPFMPVLSSLQLHILHSPFPILAGSFKSALVDSIISPLIHVVDVDIGHVVPPYELISSKYGGRLLRYALPRSAISKFPATFYLENSDRAGKSDDSQQLLGNDYVFYNTLNLDGTDEGQPIPNVTIMSKKLANQKRKTRNTTGHSQQDTEFPSVEDGAIALASGAAAYRELSETSRELQQLVPEFFTIQQLCRIIAMNSYLFTLSKSIQLSYDNDAMQTDGILKPGMFPLPSHKGIAQFAVNMRADTTVNKRLLTSKSVSNITNICPLNLPGNESSNSGDSMSGASTTRTTKPKRASKKLDSKAAKKKNTRRSFTLGSGQKGANLTQSLIIGTEQISHELSTLPDTRKSLYSPSNIFHIPSLPAQIKTRLLKLISQTACIYVDKSAGKRKSSKSKIVLPIDSQAADPLHKHSHSTFKEEPVSSANKQHPQTREQSYAHCVLDSDEDDAGASAFYPNPVSLSLMYNCMNKKPLQILSVELLSGVHCTFSSIKNLKKDYEIAKKIYVDEKNEYFEYKGYHDELRRIGSERTDDLHGKDQKKSLPPDDDEETDMYCDRLQTGFAVILLDMVKHVYACIRKRPYTELLIDNSFVQTGASGISVPRYKSETFKYLFRTKDKEVPYYVLPALSALNEEEASKEIFTGEGVVQALRRIVPDSIHTNIIQMVQEGGKYDEIFDYSTFFALIPSEFYEFMRYFVYTPFFEEFLESRLLLPAQLDGYPYHHIFKNGLMISSKHTDSSPTSFTSNFSDSCTSFVSVPMLPFIYSTNQPQGCSFQFTDGVSDATMTFSIDEQSSRPPTPLLPANADKFIVQTGEIDFVDYLMLLNSLYRSTRLKAIQGYSLEFPAAKRGQRRHVWKPKIVTVVIQASKIVLYWRRPDQKDVKAGGSHVDFDRPGQVRDKDSDDESADTTGVMLELVPGKYLAFVPYAPLLDSPEYHNCICITTSTRLLVFSMSTPESQRIMLNLLMRDELRSSERLNSEHATSKLLVETRIMRRKALGHLMETLNHEDLVLKRNIEELLIDVYSGIPLSK